MLAVTRAAKDITLRREETWFGYECTSVLVLSAESYFLAWRAGRVGCKHEGGFNEGEENALQAATARMRTNATTAFILGELFSDEDREDGCGIEVYR